jgi:hypothetical protein
MAGALADVMEDQAQKAESIREVEARRKEGRKHGPGAWILLILLLAVSAYIWIGSPAWLEAGPEPLPENLVDAGLRVEVYQQALLVNAFIESNQRLPESLEDVIDGETRVTLTPLNGLDYRLEITGPGGPVDYVSTDPLDRFLGNSMQIIQQGG